MLICPGFGNRYCSLRKIGSEPVSDSLGPPFRKIVHIWMSSKDHPSMGDHPQVSLTFRHFKTDPALYTGDPQPTVSTQWPPSLLSFY